jgi:hypothetical protein
MRKKMIALAFALTAAAAAQGFFAPKPVEAACNGFLVCCPDTNFCRCCSRPCPIQCP